MNFTPRWIVGQLELTDWPFAVLRNTADPGAPTNIASIIDSQLLDGEFSEVTHVGNRTYKLSVLIEEADSEALARAEARLFAECSKWFNELKVIPGDGFGKTSCFQVFQPELAFVADDEREWNGYRRYDIEWPALPFALAEETTTFGVTQPVDPDPEVLVNDGTTLAGTTPYFTVYPPVLAAGGVIQLDTTEYVDEYGVRHGSNGIKFDLTGKTTGEAGHTTYCYVDAKSIISLFHRHAAPGSSALGNYKPISVLALPDGSKRYVFAIDQTDTEFFLYAQYAVDASGIAHATVLIDQVYLTGDLPRPSGSEQILTAQIEGSARTTGSLQVSHPAAGLGKTIVYSAPELASGYAPSLRRFLTAGGTTTTTREGVPAFFSETWLLVNGAVFTVPVNALPPGPFVLMGHLYMGSDVSSPITVTWTAQLKVGSALVGPVQSASSDQIPKAPGFPFDAVMSLGGMVLPPLGVAAGADASVVITLSVPMASVYFDDLFLIYQGEDAALTIVDCGSGAPALGAVHNSLWLESPSVANGGLPQILVGVDGDRNTAISAGYIAQSWEVPQMPPGPLNVFIATAAVTSPDFSGTYRAAFHTHVAASTPDTSLGAA